jgi:hypothetical protein
MNARRVGVGWVLALIAVGGAMVADASIAAEWIRIEAAGSDQHAYDRSKIVIRGDEITYWRKVTFTKPVRVRNGVARNAVYQERIHCRDHTLKAIAWQVFADEGALLDSMGATDSDPASIVPETVGDRFRDIMCKLVEARRSRDADLAQDEARLAIRRKELEQLKQEIEQLELSILRTRIETGQALPATQAPVAGADSTVPSAPSRLPEPVVIDAPGSEVR